MQSQRVGWLLMCLASVALGQDKPAPGLMSQVVRLGLHDGMLTWDANPMGTKGLGKISQPFANIEGEVTVTRSAASTQVRLGNEKASVQISATAQNFSITQTITDAATSTTTRINYRQTGPENTRSPARQGAFITITIATPGEVGAKTTTQLQEKSLGELWTKHPDEVKKYLVPMFNQAGLVGVFGMSKEEARHMFAIQAPAADAGADVSAKVAELVKKLDDDSPDIRAAARHDLTALGKGGLAVLRDMDTRAMSISTRVAIKEILAGDKVEMPPDARLNDPDILLQCVALDDDQVPPLAKSQYEKVTGKKLEIDLSAPASVRAAAVEKLRMDALKGAAGPP